MVGAEEREGGESEGGILLHEEVAVPVIIVVERLHSSRSVTVCWRTTNGCFRRVDLCHLVRPVRTGPWPVRVLGDETDTASKLYVYEILFPSAEDITEIHFQFQSSVRNLALECCVSCEPQKSSQVLPTTPSPY